MKLLDNKEYDQSELIFNMQNDDYYYDFMGVNRVLSYSSAKWLLKSAKYFAWKKKQTMVETQPLRDGKLIHTQILEPNKYKKLSFIDVSSKNTKKWKEAVIEHGKENTYTLKERNINNRIVQSFLRNDACMSYLKDSTFEVPGLLEYDSIPFRGKADVLGDDYVADVKTTGDGVADISLKSGGTQNQFAFTISKYDYDMQAYLYTQMFDKPRFIWLVIDKVTTDIGIFEASQETLERGKAKLDEAMSIYSAFFLDELVDINQYFITKTI